MKFITKLRSITLGVIACVWVPVAIAIMTIEDLLKDPYDG